MTKAGDEDGAEARIKDKRRGIEEEHEGGKDLWQVSCVRRRLRFREIRGYVV